MPNLCDFINGESYLMSVSDVWEFNSQLSDWNDITHNDGKSTSYTNRCLQEYGQLLSNENYIENIMSCRFAVILQLSHFKEFFFTELLWNHNSS